jgi:hypothetical protein
MAVLHRKWHFFDKEGNHLNAINIETDSVTGEEFDGEWFAELHFERVSTGIYGVQHIFIVEEYYDTETATRGFCYPRTDDSTFFRIVWTDVDGKASDAIGIFQTDLSGEYPVIEKVAYLDIELEDGSADTLEGEIEFPRRILTGSAIRSEAIQLNFYLQSDEEYNFDRMLELQLVSAPTDEATVTPIGWFEFHGEVVAEDERFRMILENFGRKVHEEDFHVFRDVDIYEDKIDYIKLNEKRKELLLGGDQIYPYIGSYRGLVNAIKFFGYSDLRLKEYWLNVDVNSSQYGKYKQTQIDMATGAIADASSPIVNVPSRTWKKTAKFGLFYDINRTTGEFDEFGLPETEEAFMFTNEEVLIKLFSLKSVLKREFLPLNARIIDITGEGIWFEKYGINTWTDINERIDVDEQMFVDFRVTPRFPYIKDLSAVTDVTFTKALSTQQKVGAIVTLENLSFDLKLNEMTMTFDEVKETGWTFLNAGQKEIYEIEWRIHYKGENGYTYRRRGTPTEIGVHTVALPYAGLYDVTLVLFDTLGRAFNLTRRNHIEARSYEAEMIGFCRFFPADTTIAGMGDLPLWKAQAPLHYPVHHDSEIGDCNIKLDSLNYRNYFEANGVDPYLTKHSIRSIDRDNSAVVIFNDISNEIDVSNMNYLLFSREYEEVSKEGGHQLIWMWSEDGGEDTGFTIMGRNRITIGDRVVLFKKFTATAYTLNASARALTLAGDMSAAIIPGNVVVFIKADGTRNQFVIEDGFFAGADTVAALSDPEDLLGEEYVSVEVQYDYFTFDITLVSYDRVNGDDMTSVLIDDSTGNWDKVIEAAGNGDTFYSRWGLYAGEYAIKIKDYRLIPQGTRIELDDEFGELFGVTALFKASVAPFDIDRAKRRYGVNIFTLENFKDVTLNDMKHQTFFSMDYRGMAGCGFNISKVAPGGMIQINEGPLFIFSDDPEMTMESAAAELNASKLPWISRFTYTVLPDDPEDATRFILASAKIPGANGLAYVKFSNGVESDWCGSDFETFTYPLANTKNWIETLPQGVNNPPEWHHLYKMFYDYGETYPPKKLGPMYVSKKNPWNGYRIPYSHMVEASFSLTETLISDREFSVPVMTTVFAVTDNCKVPFQSGHIWRLYNERTGELIVEIRDRYFIWTFDTAGSYSLEASVLDPNGNESSKKKSGWITVTSDVPEFSEDYYG